MYYFSFRVILRLGLVSEVYRQILGSGVSGILYFVPWWARRVSGEYISFPMGSKSSHYNRLSKRWRTEVLLWRMIPATFKFPNLLVIHSEICNKLFPTIIISHKKTIESTTQETFEAKMFSSVVLLIEVMKNPKFSTSCGQLSWPVQRVSLTAWDASHLPRGDPRGLPAEDTYGSTYCWPPCLKVY